MWPEKKHRNIGPGDLDPEKKKSSGFVISCVFTLSPTVEKIKEKSACIWQKSMLLYKGCGMIAMKREVAAYENERVFPWSECQVMKLATSHCTN